MIRKMVWTAALLLSGMTGAQAWGASVLQCVPYARTVSGVDLYGDALNWWDQADGRFKRLKKARCWRSGHSAQWRWGMSRW